MQTVRIENADKLYRLLRELPKHATQSKSGGVVALAIRKGSKPMMEAVRKNLQRSIEIGGDESSGLLMKNLKLRRHKYEGKGEYFTIGVGNKRYPTGKKGATTKLNGARLEYGTSHQAPIPWIRPAFNVHAEQTIKDITVDLEKRLDKLAAQYLVGG